MLISVVDFLAFVVVALAVMRVTEWCWRRSARLEREGRE